MFRALNPKPGTFRSVLKEEGYAKSGQAPLIFFQTLSPTGTLFVPNVLVALPVQSHVIQDQFKDTVVHL